MLTLSRYITQNYSPNKYTFHLKPRFKQKNIVVRGGFCARVFTRAHSQSFVPRVPADFSRFYLNRTEKKKIKIFSTIVKNSCIFDFSICSMVRFSKTKSMSSDALPYTTGLFLIPSFAVLNS